MQIKQHGTAAVVAAVIAGGMQATMPAKVVEKPVQVTIATSKYAWPDLSDPEKAALGERVKWLAGSKVKIFCDGADCRDLQTDLDDAFEDAGISSDRAFPFDPLGYGIAVVYRAGAEEKAARLAADIKAASGGKIAPAIRSNPTAFDGLIIAIGKRPRR